MITDRGIEKEPGRVIYYKGIELRKPNPPGKGDAAY
jgi:hypothetical protein